MTFLDFYLIFIFGLILIFLHFKNFNLDVKYSISSYICLLLFLIIYICLIFILIYYGDLGLDLQTYFTILQTKMHSMSTASKILYLSLKILNFLLLVSIVIKVKKILTWKIWQIHFYWYHLTDTIKIRKIELPGIIEKSYSTQTIKISKFYYNLVKILAKTILGEAIANFIWEHIAKYVIQPLYRIFYRHDYDYLNEYSFHIDLILPLKYFFRLLFLVIFIYESICNNWILHNTIYYALFYINFSLWYSISLALFYQRGGSESEILFERAYYEPEILYVNITEKEELELNNYVKNPSNISNLTPLMDFVPFYKNPFGIHPISAYRRYYKIKTNDISHLISKKKRKTLDEYIWCNFIKDPKKLYWFNKKDLTIIEEKNIVKEKEINKKT